VPYQLAFNLWNLTLQRSNTDPGMIKYGGNVTEAAFVDVARKS